MRKWILFALVGLLLAYLFMRREGFQDTAGIKGIYALDGPDPSHPAIGSSAEHVIGRYVLRHVPNDAIFNCEQG